MKEALKRRTKSFAIQIVRMTDGLPNKQIGWTITNQIVRSGTSVAANYRAVCRAKSDKDFISKMETVIEEADETIFWLELILDLALIPAEEIEQLMKEGNELISIFVSSVKTVKKRLNN
ncbi:four helix bundle protein [Flavobacterium sp. CBA20B-1]|uniref:four helix bundle protein n=1 Tax=unclassified Flavobacterium TaxID=196869 RepID=UPI002225B39F|nr:MULTISPECIES: four helix bundle protein [unclassified Flavobacterium]WCM41264.1 four helix bundle protein [Flavobacterium sp. CBA20B-1]